MNKIVDGLRRTEYLDPLIAWSVFLGYALYGLAVCFLIAQVPHILTR